MRDGPASGAGPVLVTGGTGFVGRYVVEMLLQRGRTVRVLARSAARATAALGADVVIGDLHDAGAVKRACVGVSEVHHVGACVDIWASDKEANATNVEGTQNVIAACRAAGTSILVFTSSASVVFDGEDQHGVDERVPYPRRFRNAYCRTKAQAEQLVLAAHEPHGLRTLALRPHLVWGPRDTHLIPNLIGMARQGRLVRIGDGTNLIDITYVENLADAHVLAADRLRGEPTPGGRAYFVSQGEPVNPWEFVESLLALLDLPAVRKSLTYRRAMLIGAFCEVAWPLLRARGRPPMTRFMAAQFARSHYFDISAARRYLGYRPRISTAEGLRRLAASLVTQTTACPSLG